MEHKTNYRSELQAEAAAGQSEFRLLFYRSPTSQVQTVIYWMSHRPK